MQKLTCFDLSGKVALITGGATGIGRGIAEGLAEAGASVVIAARRLEVCENACREIHERTGASAFAFRCDVTRKLDRQRAVEGMMELFGKIDILVNNSGVGGSEKPIMDMDEKDWHEVIETNLSAVFFLSQAVARTMADRGEGGKIINVVSIGAQIAWPNMSAYCASKGGCLQLTKVMALEWAKHNIQVNAILPGYFETPMNKDFFASEIGKRVIATSIPTRRIANISEIKGVAVLLVSQASSFMTGSAVVVDGGQTCW
jgi:2-deoxy-D-gluconate 3-dehydrogenase